MTELHMRSWAQDMRHPHPCQPSGYITAWPQLLVTTPRNSLCSGCRPVIELSTCSRPQTRRSWRPGWRPSTLWSAGTAVLLYPLLVATMQRYNPFYCLMYLKQYLILHFLLLLITVKTISMFNKYYLLRCEHALLL